MDGGPRNPRLHGATRRPIVKITMAKSLIGPPEHGRHRVSPQRITAHAWIFAPLVAAACASAGTRPHDMSAAEHERAAKNDDERAKTHTREYDEGAWQPAGDCGEFCFSTWSNPAGEHAGLARRHRRLAAKHRAASETLRNAEAEACQDIPERDRDVSPFFHSDDIVGFERLPQAGAEGPVSFRVHFEAIHGVDVDAMQRLLDCHLARNAARGHEAPEMPYCPLVPTGVEAKAEATDTGVDIVLTAQPPAHYEVEERLQAIMDERRSHEPSP